MKGFLAAATWMKAEVFLKTAEIQKELHNSVARAVEKMVYFYMRNTPEQKSPGFGVKFPGGHLLAEQEKEISVYSQYYSFSWYDSPMVFIYIHLLNMKKQICSCFLRKT